ncbi:hypothetical protein C1280_27630 [Gemmata obscuriglobus]|uniref:Uncharacterized protein n=1 Tax=Gemmata obscuriglobus TaxID=114 RepID=A0A2Z3HLP7_9BACT|nr:hypothetical protein C1280_27630 [Gemmata obscuriglobus]
MSEAIWADDLATVAAIIAAGADVNAADEPHWPLLFQAIEHQRTEIARRLIAAGADINCDVGAGWTPLVHAIDIESDAAWQANHEAGHESTELTALLLAAGAIPTERAFESARAYNNRKALSLLEGARQAEPGAAPDTAG